MSLDIAVVFLSGIFIYQPIINFGFIPSSAEGMTRAPSKAIGYSLTGGILIAAYSFSAWVLYFFILEPLKLLPVALPLMMLLMWGWHSLIKLALRKFSMIRDHLPFYFLNIAVLGSGFILIHSTPAGPILAFVRAIGIAVGFLMTNMLVSFFQEKMGNLAFPNIMRGWPLYFILCSIFWLSYYGISLLF